MCLFFGIYLISYLIMLTVEKNTFDPAQVTFRYDSTVIILPGRSFTLEDAIGSHNCYLQASIRVIQ
jgi:hypothetical protein